MSNIRESKTMAVVCEYIQDSFQTRLCLQFIHSLIDLTYYKIGVPTAENWYIKTIITLLLTVLMQE